MDVVLTAGAAGTAPGLVLRPWAEGDIPALLAAHRDPLLRRWLQHPVRTLEEARRLVAATAAGRLAGTHFSFAVLEASGGDSPGGNLIGSVSLRRPDEAAVTGDVGYWVTAPARGRGIAPRALEAVCEWAFRPDGGLALQRLELLHAVGNQASCRVAEKAGFALAEVLAPLPPEFPDNGHRHVRLAR
jgi:RimJ/RimL family protein N-acetyltransferase